ncbi:MAG: methylenetetrahydrofolate reductase [Thaumarchaeota archaeon]|nr:methylenetetrahydrofolate reductase [Nitrososphaerota archaeon]
MKITEFDGYIKMLELSPPKIPSLSEVFDKVERVAGYFDMITFAEPLMRREGDSYMGTVYTSLRVKERFGIDVIPYLTCREHNWRDISANLIVALDAHIQNFLILSGDCYVGKGHSLEVREFYPSKLIEKIKNRDNPFLQQNVCLGTAFNTNASKIKKEVTILKKKFEKGADFIQTQLIFDVDMGKEAFELASKEGIEIPIILEVTVLKSYKYAMNLVNNFDIVIPQDYMDRIKDVEERERRLGNLRPEREVEEEGVKITLEILKKLRNHANGLCISWVSMDSALEVVGGLDY